MTAQLLRIPSDDYHARDGFSSSLAKLLIERSPAHAKAEYRKPATKEMDRGSVVHRLVLGAGKDFEVLHFDSFRTNAAKDARDKARAAGKVPILEEAFAEANVIAESVRVQLLERGITLDGESEIAIEWHEDSAHGPVLCRCMLDHLWLGDGRILDLKITGNAAPNAVERNAESMGYAIQEAAYRRALVALEPGLAGRVDFLFAFAEAEQPYAMNIARGDGMFREIGERRWLRAVETWARCMAEDNWPAYGAGVNPLSPPPWALAKEEYV
jgi:hypothetical protein